MKPLKSDSRIEQYALHLIIAMVLVFTGLSLWLSINYFFWPPMLLSFLNDDVVGFSGFLIGLGIIWWVFSKAPSKSVNTVLLSLSSVYMGLLSMIELGHVLFASSYRTIGDVIPDIAILLLIFYCSNRS